MPRFAFQHLTFHHFTFNEMIFDVLLLFFFKKTIQVAYGKVPLRAGWARMLCKGRAPSVEVPAIILQMFREIGVCKTCCVLSSSENTERSSGCQKVLCRVGCRKGDFDAETEPKNG